MCAGPVVSTEPCVTCERGAFFQDPWGDYKPQQTGSSPASPTFDLRFGKSLRAPPSEESGSVSALGANVNKGSGDCGCTQTCLMKDMTLCVPYLSMSGKLISSQNSTSHFPS